MALLATTAFLIVSPPLYRSEATVFVRTPGDVSRVRDGGDSYAQARARTYAALASSRSVSERIIANVGLDMKPETLAGRITAQNLPAQHSWISRSLRPPLEKPSAQRPRCFREYAATVRALESVPGSLVPRAELVVVDPPRPAARVVAWGAPITMVLLGAALLGAFLGSVGAVVRSILDPSARDRSKGSDPHISAASVSARVTMGSEGAEASAVDVVNTPMHALDGSERSTDVDQLSRTAAAELIGRLRSEYDDVIIAGAPVLATTAASPTAEYADEVVLVASIGKTRRSELSRAAAKLRATGAQLTGTVLIGKEDGGVGPGEPSTAQMLESEP